MRLPRPGYFFPAGTCYFVPDTRKAGGAYCTVTGGVKKMAELEGLLIMADGTEVPMGEISVLELHE